MRQNSPEAVLGSKQGLKGANALIGTERDLYGAEVLYTEQSRERLIWLVHLRWIAIFAVLFVIFLTAHILKLVRNPLPLVFIVALMSLFNLCLFRSLKSHGAGFLSPLAFKKNAWTQIIFDILFLTGLIHYSGGIQNPFLFFYIFHVVIAGILLSRKEAFGVSSIALGTLSTIALCEYTGWISSYPLKWFPHLCTTTPGYLESAQNPYHILGVLAVLAISLGGCAYFTTSIMQGFRRTANLAVRERNLLAAIMENMQEGVIFVDNRGDVIFCNPSAKRLAQCSHQAIDIYPSYCHCFKIFQDKDRMIQNLLEGHQNLYQRKREENGKHILDTFTTVQGSNGCYQGMVWVMQDLTEFQELQERLAKTEALAVVGEIASGIAHEIGSPLEGALDCIRFLQRHPQDSEKVSSFSQLITDALERISIIIRGLLTFSRHHRIRKEAVYLAEIFDRSLTFVEHRLKREGIHVEKYLQENIPIISADPLYLSQALINLIRNAIDAVPQGGWIRLEARHIGASSDGIAEIRVSDNGCGIKAEDLDRIFEPFYTTKDSNGGTGLGLAITQQIIMEHGGNIFVESSPGKGSTFIIQLPVEA